MWHLATLFFHYQLGLEVMLTFWLSCLSVFFILHLLHIIGCSLHSLYKSIFLVNQLALATSGIFWFALAFLTWEFVSRFFIVENSYAFWPCTFSKVYPKSVFLSFSFASMQICGTALLLGIFFFFATLFRFSCASILRTFCGLTSDAPDTVTDLLWPISESSFYSSTNNSFIHQQPIVVFYFPWFVLHAFYSFTHIYFAFAEFHFTTINGITSSFELSYAAWLQPYFTLF